MTYLYVLISHLRIDQRQPQAHPSRLGRQILLFAFEYLVVACIVSIVQAKKQVYCKQRKMIRLLLFLASLSVSAQAFQHPGHGFCRHRLQASASGDDPVVRLPLMEAELATLDSSKDSKDLETAIGDAKTAAEFGVRRAQLQFYDAFSQGDIQAMGEVWSTESHVRCVHPGMVSLEGREAVMESWKQIFSGGGGQFDIEPERSQIEICGLTAICSCVEKTQGGGQLEALNIYKREGGTWRMTLHMAGPVVVQSGGGAVF